MTTWTPESSASAWSAPTSGLYGSPSRALASGRFCRISFRRTNRVRSLKIRTICSSRGPTESLGRSSSAGHFHLGQVVGHLGRPLLQALPENPVAPAHHQHHLSVRQRPPSTPVVATVDRRHLNPGGLHGHRDQAIAAETGEVVHQVGDKAPISARSLLRSAEHERSIEAALGL